MISEDISLVCHFDSMCFLQEQTDLMKLKLRGPLLVQLLPTTPEGAAPISFTWSYIFVSFSSSSLFITIPQVWDELEVVQAILGPR